MFDSSAAKTIPAASEPRTLAESQILVYEQRTTRLHPANHFAAVVQRNDCVVFNNSGTMPASLATQTRSGENIELRLYRAVEAPDGALHCIIFGDGDFRTRTELRPRPANLKLGDELSLRENPNLALAVTTLDGRIATLRTLGNHQAIDVLYRYGRAIQYSYVPDAIHLWDVQNAFAARPWSVENPSAGRVLDHACLQTLRARGVDIAAVTHAAGLSTTGVQQLDQTLPWCERYEVPSATVETIERTRARGGRVIALGTSTVRALESAARGALAGVTNLRIHGDHKLMWVDAIVTGVHTHGSSHADLLRAFVSSTTQDRLLARSYDEHLQAHEFGDFWFVERE